MWSLSALQEGARDRRTHPLQIPLHLETLEFGKTLVASRDVDISSWHLDRSVKEWWTNRAGSSTPNRKATASLMVLVIWTIWNKKECNALPAQECTTGNLAKHRQDRREPLCRCRCQLARGHNIERVIIQCKGVMLVTQLYSLLN